MSVSEICQIVISLGFLTTSVVLCLSVRRVCLLSQDLADICDWLSEVVGWVEDSGFEGPSCASRDDAAPNGHSAPHAGVRPKAGRE